ncbi:hypothetical protein C1631_016535 [Chryseobacterium phosphatilyticum]|uniref:Uncharacterized protein n=1 Tax=Chryseobacterium phosphatilyticum TaxID=475075 RepID=A0A316X3K2_9FLAO|nr:hypothetical protein [Chryseobacterium phosphatilyticum]PWN68305.1 hypothetical protein C1631_016535 [Chryseobacterium phosphatilyticum]
MKKTLLLLSAVVSVTAASQIGINTSNPQGIFHVDGSKDNAVTGVPTILQQANDFTITSTGSVGVGTVVPHSSALLDINTDGLAANNKKGVLFPRVPLNSNTDVITIPNPATGLMVYNTGTGSLLNAGYVYWNGSEWRSITNTTSIAPKISSLNCSGAKLNPPTYTAGQVYNGTMTVPYSGGNGGSYPAGSSIVSTGVTGLTATLQGGTLSNGGGFLTYFVSGTPSASSPNTASFVIPPMFGASSCTATVGADVLNIGETVTAIYSVPNATAANTAFNLSSYVAANGLQPLPTIDGIEVSLQGNSSAYYYPRIYNRASTSQLISYQSFATQVNQNKTNLNVTLASGDFENTDSDGIVYWTTSAAEVETTNLQVQVNTNTYRWYEIKWWCMEVSGAKKIFISLTRKA